jgi:hypothetical protein
MAERYKEKIEQLTDRKVLAFLSQAHVDPDLTVEMQAKWGPAELCPPAWCSSRRRSTATR